jgi:hypothetical protein
MQRKDEHAISLFCSVLVFGFGIMYYIVIAKLSMRCNRVNKNIY